LNLLSGRFGEIINSAIATPRAAPGSLSPGNAGLELAADNIRRRAGNKNLTRWIIEIHRARLTVRYRTKPARFKFNILKNSKRVPLTQVRAVTKSHHAP
jgi:hypothetical protein